MKAPGYFENINPIELYLQKPSKDFTKSDLIKYIFENNIEVLNFRYVGGDGRLKTLNFIVTNKKQIDELLSTGERVDGSSLFSYVEACSSDLYVFPRYKTAFLNPFYKDYNPLSEKPLVIDILCSYYDKNGDPLPSAPDNILRKAHQTLLEKTGIDIHAMGELEYYIISEEDKFYPARDQKGYHESGPFSKWESLRLEAMKAIAQCGGLIKYGHSEVGNFTKDGTYFEQNEIEFLPTDINDAADQLIIARWILRKIAYNYGVTISFAPKITVGKAGSGMHVHIKLLKDNRNIMLNENGKLSDTAIKAIAGLLELSPALTAFGNTIPTSYLRLVPHQEAPTNICWGERNRSALIRVPLGWTDNAPNKMIKHANPNTFEEEDKNFSEKQTFEFRCPDGSADIYLLMAGICVAVRHGLELPNALEIAKNLFVDVNIFKDEHKHIANKLKQLPASCWESADKLNEMQDIFTKYNVFSKGVINNIIKNLKSYNDLNLSEKLFGKHDEIYELVMKYLHCS